MLRRGFTLIELLIVVAIIAILAAIAIPNYLHAQTRAKIARAEADMQSIAVALESYHTDWLSYPPEDGYYGVDFQAYRRITTPVSYLQAMPMDSFNTQGIAANNGNQGWYQIGTGSMRVPGVTPNAERDVYVIASYGPDMLDDTHYIMWFPRTNQACPYDPTNGMASKGEIYRFSPSTDQKYLINFRQALNPRHWGNPP